MTEEQWNEAFAKAIGVFLNGERAPRCGRATVSRSIDDSFLLLFNAADHALEFTFPPGNCGDEWAAVLDTNEPQLQEDDRVSQSGREVSGREPVDGGAAPCRLTQREGDLPGPAALGIRVRRTQRRSSITSRDSASLISTCSPNLQARPGSTHGYDVVDHSRISRSSVVRLGFRSLVAAWGPGIDHFSTSSRTT